MRNRPKIRLGVSSCLLGENVRYDGGHRLDRFIHDTLGRYVDFIPVCPEFEAGLGVPREAMRLAGLPESPRLVTIHSGKDFTAVVKDWAREKIRELQGCGLAGFIFKSNSPSSGMERVRVYGDSGVPSRKGVGIFARMFMEAFPHLPVEDEGRLNDPILRENFVERIFAMKRWADLAGDRKTWDRLVSFHTRHKLLLMSHSPKIADELGKIIAGLTSKKVENAYREYENKLAEALKIRSSVKKNVNVLQHAMGYFKKQLSADEKKELLEILENYRQGFIPLIVPVTLMNHYIRKYGEDYLASQWYFNPHPIELQLRNHA